MVLNDNDLRLFNPESWVGSNALYVFFDFINGICWNFEREPAVGGSGSTHRRMISVSVVGRSQCSDITSMLNFSRASGPAQPTVLSAGSDLTNFDSDPKVRTKFI